MLLHKKEKKKLIEELPFPLANLYQDTMYTYACFFKKDDTEKEVQNPLWNVLKTAQFLMKFVAFISLEHYSNLRNEVCDFDLNRELLDNLQAYSPDWFSLAKKINDVLSEANISNNTLPELKRLLEYNINFKGNVPPNFPEKINKYKYYQWFEVMMFFQNLKEYLLNGLYRFQLPSQEVIEFYIHLLEVVLLHCDVIKADVYILVGKDERKSRGFLCKSTRIKSIGIRGAFDIPWNDLQDKPFIWPDGQKNYLFLYPLVISWLVRQKGYTAFSDLLFYSHRTQDKIYYYSYRNNTILPHDVCDETVLAQWQTWFRWLEKHTSRRKKQESLNSKSKIVQETTFVLESQHKIFHDLVEKLQYNIAGYYYFRTNANRIKEHVVNYLLSEFSTKYKDDYIILYHAFGKQEDWCDPLLIIKNMFLSIRKNIYDDSIENVSSFSSSFPNNLDSLQIYCQQILDNCSKEILQPNQKKMVIFLDGIDYLALSSERLKTFISVFPKNLPANIFVLLSWQMQEDKSILSEGYILDGIPLYPFKEYPIECRELQGSPLTCFSQQEMLKWLMHDFPMIPTYRKNELCKILWNKSKGGDLRYFSLWREAIYQGRLQWDCWDLWPEGHLEFYNSIIENLPAHENYVAYNFLLLLCIVQHECTDEFVGQVFQIPYYIIAPIRWQLNLVLEYTKGGYSLISWMSQYLEKIIPIKEQQEMHQILAKFYQQQDRSGGDMRQKALYYLPKHLCEGKKFQEAYTLLVESSFPTEKLRYFKSYQPYLYDIYQILYSYYKSKQYEDFLPMMYRYHLILQEATCDIQKAFQASANGKYEFALDTIRLNQDENEQFQEMLVVLWYALQEENTKHAIYILEEFKRIPDSHIVFFSKGIRPFFEFLLKRLKQKNILRVDYLIGKNTFQGQKAINYLLELQSKINFPSSQLYFLMHVIFKHMDSIESDKEKQNIVQKVSPIWFQLESDKSFIFLRVLETKKTLLYFWGKLLSFVDSIQNIEIRWECLYSLYHTAWETKQEQYWNPIQERAKNFQNSSPSGQTLAYILCILEFDGESFFKEQYNNIFLKELFDTLFAIWKEKPTDKVAYDWLIRLLLHSEIVEIIDKEKFIHLLATQGDIEKALSLLNQITNIRMRAKLFLIILDYIQENISDEHIWNLALDTFSDITSERDFIENITAKIATGLWESGFVTHDTLWKKFQTICENVAEISIRNKILTVLTLEYAGHDLVNKARNLLLKVTSSHLYSNALVGIAQQLFKKREWEGILEHADEMVVINDALKIYSAISQQLEEGDANIPIWRKLAIAFCRLGQEQTKDGSPSKEYILDILKNFSMRCPWETTASWWQNMFTSLETICELSNYVAIVSELLLFWSENVDYSTTKQFLLYLENRADSWNYPRITAEFYLQYAHAMVRWNQFMEAGQALQKAWKSINFLEISETSLEYMTKVAAVYLELGKDAECKNILIKITEIIENNREILELDYFIEHALSIGLDKYSCTMIQTILLENIQEQEENISSETLMELAKLCIKTKQYPWVRLLFFRLLPLFYKEDETDQYLFQILEQMSDHQDFPLLWQSLEELVFNLPTVEKQKSSLESLAIILSKQKHKDKILWQKIFQDIQYNGATFNSLSCMFQIGKYYIPISTDEEIQEIFFTKNSIVEKYWKQTEIFIFTPEEHSILLQLLLDMLQVSPDTSKYENIIQQAKERQSQYKVKTTVIQKSEELPIQTSEQKQLVKVQKELQQGNFQNFFKVFLILPKESILKLQLLQTYGASLNTETEYEQAFQLLELLDSTKERTVFLKSLANICQERNNIPGLFRLCLSMLDDKDALYYLTTKILHVIHQTYDLETYYHWFEIVTKSWGLEAPY